MCKYFDVSVPACVLKYWLEVDFIVYPVYFISLREYLLKCQTPVGEIRHTTEGLTELGAERKEIVL